VQFLVHSHFMINAPFLVIYVLLTAPSFNEMRGVRRETEMTQPHGGPRSCIYCARDEMKQ
jgi:hypothetical protein